MATTELTSAPRTGALLAKAALGALPLPGTRRAATLPDTELVLSEREVDPDHLARYARVCGFSMRDELPATYPHVLVFPLAMRLMSDRSFPFPLIGLVHVNNTITQVRPLRLGERLTLRVRVANLRPHERGRQFDVIHEAAVGGELVWRDVSTYLRRGGAGAGRATVDESARPRSPSSTEPTGPTGATERTGPADRTGPTEPAAAVWRVGDDIGRRYAAVSGDRNPIHLHPLAARAFGFPRAIAHGMWTKARCIAALEGRLPVSYAVDVAFKLPVLLPAKVAFGAEQTGNGGWRFALRDDRTGRPHLAGTITPS